MSIKEPTQMEDSSTVLLENTNLLTWCWALLLVIMKGDIENILELFQVVKGSMCRALSHPFGEVASTKAFCFNKRREFYLSQAGPALNAQ